MPRRGDRQRAITVMLKTEVHDHLMFKIRMAELESLLDTLGVATVHRVVQVRRRPTTNFLLGRGKVEELRTLVRRLSPDMVVFYNVLSSKQRWNLERALRAEVLDRYDVTLRIFRLAARDVLSKLQIELAELSRSFPDIKLAARMKYMKMKAGFRGGGEYAYHSQLRAVQRRIKTLRDKISRLTRDKLMRIERIRREGGSIVSLTGYYNAGKTSLFNALTGMSKPVSPEPFTTLSSKYASLSGGGVYLVDTIGFVIDLDPRLIQSFNLNLLDVANSSVVLLVADAADSADLLGIKIREALDILDRIGVPRDALLLVLNKVDLVDARALSARIASLDGEIRELPRVLVSAKTGFGLEDLIHSISGMLKEREPPPEITSDIGI